MHTGRKFEDEVKTKVADPVDTPRDCENADWKRRKQNRTTTPIVGRFRWNFESFSWFGVCTHHPMKKHMWKRSLTLVCKKRCLWNFLLSGKIFGDVVFACSTSWRLIINVWTITVITVATTMTKMNSQNLQILVRVARFVHATAVISDLKSPFFQWKFVLLSLPLF